MAENIICFKESLLPDSAGERGAFYDGPLWDLILSNLEIMPRDSVEDDVSYKQIVVYALIGCGGKYLSYVRTPKTTESRLRSRSSIGIGGHVNTDDERQLTLFGGGLRDGFIEEALWREVNEEVKLGSPVASPPELVCFINDDSTPVGRVHFGVVWMLEIIRPEVFLKGEKGIGCLEFLGLSDLERDIESYENWSKIMIEYLTAES